MFQICLKKKEINLFMYVQEHVRNDYVYKLEKLKHKLTYK